MGYFKVFLNAMVLIICSVVNALSAGMVYHFVARARYFYESGLIAERQTEIFYELEISVALGLVFGLTIVVVHYIIEDFAQALGKKS